MDLVAKSPDELRRDLGAAVRALRLRADLTQADAASKAGVALRSLANLERGGGSSVDTFVRTLNALGAAEVITAMAPQPQVSPMALLRSRTGLPQRVRHRNRLP